MSVLVSEMGYGEQQRIRILSPLCYAAVSHFCVFCSYNVRIGIRDGIRRAAEDKNIIAIVLCSKGKLFIAGADMKEFQNGKGAIGTQYTLTLAIKRISSAGAQ